MPSLFSSSPNPATAATGSTSANASSVMSVSMLNHSVARLLESQIPLCWISGEVSNFTRAASGHWYFTLKDDGAQVRAVMFRGRAQYASFQPRDGDRLEVRANVTLYAPRGDYQLNIEAIRRAGVGNLYEAFLQLKEKLAAQGLFAAENKRPLPRFPRTIGIITSPQAAALRDVLTSFARRSPHLQLILYPVPVQGVGAAEKIAQMLALASQRNECDVLLLCRGGGSIEDLWCFNEEVVAHAIAACELPVICGVGHETDFTISDFVADLRAATPTAAAEMASPATEDCLASIAHSAQRMQRAMQRQINLRGQQLDYLSRRLPSPSALLKREQMRLNALQARMQYRWRSRREQAGHTLAQLQTRLQGQLPSTALPKQRLHVLAKRISQLQQQQVQQARQQLQAQSEQLELLNPQRTLERGYAIVSTANGEIVRSNTQLLGQAALHLRLAEGSAQLRISETKLDDPEEV